ncbi:phosphatase 2C-like domain-containing protein, partial [Armillaria luteobubalina]
MKIQKRFYTGIPIPIRARNLHTAPSPLSFFDSPPTPPPTTPRNTNIVRFAAESKGLGSALCGFDVVRRGWEGPGKSRERKGRRLILDVGGYGIPKRCTDAFFVRRNAMGVADGVGGWARGQTIPVILERAYEKTIKAHVEKEQPISYVITVYTPTTARYPLISANTPRSDYPNHCSQAHQLPCSQVLDHVNNGEAVVKIAHVGDCMGMLVRGTECVWRSDEMWWSFNTPVQLGPTTPAQPSTTAHEDDILILATDGLTTTGRRAGRDVLAAGMLSEVLCSRAKRIAKDAEGDTPFERRATEEGRKWRGGKNDDISVVVAVISRAGESESREA